MSSHIGTLRDKQELTFLAAIGILLAVYKIGRFWGEYHWTSKALVTGSLLGGLYALFGGVTLEIPD